MTPSEWHDEDPEGAELAADVCGLLADYTAAIVREGAVERPDASVDVELLIALIAWERDASDQSTARLRIAFLDAMDAWWAIPQEHEKQRSHTQGAWKRE